MARPQKRTVEYFSHDSDAGDSRTLSILFNHFGHEGISAWWLLLERVSRTRNHVISISNGEDIEFLAAKMHFKPARLKAILVKMAELEAIDKPLFERGIIWCQHFVDRLETVYKARKESIPLKPILPQKLPIPETSLLGEETPFLTPETQFSVSKTLQSKESIVKRVKESSSKKPYGEFNNVLLTDEEHEKLITSFGEAATKEHIETLSSGMAASPNKYKYTNHYAAVKNWARRKGVEIGKGRGNTQKLPDRNTEYTEPPPDPGLDAIVEANRKRSESAERESISHV